MDLKSMIETDVYEKIVTEMLENAEELGVDVKKILEGKDSVCGTWVMQSFFSGEARIALEQTEYSGHVINLMVPLLLNTKEEFFEVDVEAKNALKSHLTEQMPKGM